MFYVLEAKVNNVLLLYACNANQKWPNDNKPPNSETPSTQVNLIAKTCKRVKVVINIIKK